MRPVPAPSLLLACCYTTSRACCKKGRAPKVLTGVPRSEMDLLVRPSTVLSGSGCRLSKSRRLEGARSSVVHEGLFRGGSDHLLLSSLQVYPWSM